jgi:acetyl-CoA carboxylase beta subunit
MGTIDSLPVELVVLDFAFMGASMGSVVGEKIVRAADRAAAQHSALITVSASSRSWSTRRSAASPPATPAWAT